MIKKSKFLQNAKQELVNTNFKQLEPKKSNDSMNDSKDFQDAESIRSGNSHVTSRQVSFPSHPIPEGMLRHTFVTPSRREGPPSIWDTHGISGNVFANRDASLSAPLSSRIESVEFIERGAAPFINSGKE